VVQNIEELGAELKLEALRDAEVLQETRIQIPETRPLHDVPAIAVLSRQRDAEVGLRADDVDAIKVWVGPDL